MCELLVIEDHSRHFLGIVQMSCGAFKLQYSAWLECDGPSVARTPCLCTRSSVIPAVGDLVVCRDNATFRNGEKSLESSQWGKNDVFYSAVIVSGASAANM